MISCWKSLRAQRFSCSWPWVVRLLNKADEAPRTAVDKPRVVRAATVNMGYVINKCERGKEFKHQLEVAVTPYVKKSKLLKENIGAWEQAIKNEDFVVDSREQLIAKIVGAKRELADMELEMQRLRRKKQEDNFVTLWKEIQGGVKANATQHGVALVLGWGDPMDKTLHDQFPNVNRMMLAMDQGSMVPLFIRSSVDIEEQVTELLNKTVRKKGD